MLPAWPEVVPEEPIDPEEPEVLPLCPYVEPEELLGFEALLVSEVPLWPVVAVEPELPVLFCAVLLDELGFCEFDIDPLLFVSLPVEFVEVVPFDAVDVPGCDAWLPAVELVPDTEPDCEVPDGVSLPDAVRVFLLLLLQPNASAAASAKPYAYFMRFLLEGNSGAAFRSAAALGAGKSPAASKK